MSTYHLAIFEHEADTELLAEMLQTLQVPNVTTYAKTVQVPIPADVEELDHMRVLGVFAKTVSQDYKIARASGD